MGTILKFRNISKVFFRKETHPMTFNFIYDSISNKKKKFSALDNINLDIEEGEIFGLIGQNGAGKTTLLRILSQIIIPDSGKIFFKNKNIFSYKKSKYNIVPSDMAIFDLFDARMTLQFYAEIYNKKITNENIIEILKKVTLNDVSSLPINRYSTGMIQKLKFAKIIMLDPKIILFDEPTSALKYNSGSAVFCQEFSEKFNLTECG